MDVESRAMDFTSGLQTVHEQVANMCSLGHSGVGREGWDPAWVRKDYKNSQKEFRKEEHHAGFPIQHLKGRGKIHCEWHQQLDSRPMGGRKCWLSASQNFLKMNCLEWTGQQGKDVPAWLVAGKMGWPFYWCGNSCTRQKVNSKVGHQPSQPSYWAHYLHHTVPGWRKSVAKKPSRLILFTPRGESWPLSPQASVLIHSRFTKCSGDLNTRII